LEQYAEVIVVELGVQVADDLSELEPEDITAGLLPAVPRRRLLRAIATVQGVHQESPAVRGAPLSPAPAALDRDNLSSWAMNQLGEARMFLPKLSKTSSSNFDQGTQTARADIEEETQADVERAEMLQVVRGLQRESAVVKRELAAVATRQVEALLTHELRLEEADSSAKPAAARKRTIYDDDEDEEGEDEEGESWAQTVFGLTALGYSGEAAQSAMVEASGDVGRALDLLESGTG
jgi:hypothetical protein